MVTCCRNREKNRVKDRDVRVHNRCDWFRSDPRSSAPAVCRSAVHQQQSGRMDPADKPHQHRHTASIGRQTRQAEKIHIHQSVYEFFNLRPGIIGQVKDGHAQAGPEQLRGQRKQPVGSLLVFGIIISGWASLDIRNLNQHCRWSLLCTHAVIYPRLKYRAAGDDV